MEKNKYFNGIHLNTENNNKIILDDKNKGIIIETTNHHKISLDDGADNGVEIKTTNGNILTMFDTERFIKLKSTDNQGIIIDDKNELVGIIHKSGSRMIFNKKGGIDVFAPNDINIVSKTHITMQAPRIDLNPSGDGFLGSLASFAFDTVACGLGGGSIMDTIKDVAGGSIMDTIKDVAGGSIMDTIKDVALETVTDAIGVDPNDLVNQVKETISSTISETTGSSIINTVKEELGLSTEKK
jgi:hypothetical protein